MQVVLGEAKSKLCLLPNENATRENLKGLQWLWPHGWGVTAALEIHAHMVWLVLRQYEVITL